MKSIKIVIRGDPVAKGRPRFARIGKGVRTYTPKKTETWESYARLCAQQVMAGRPPIKHPISLKVDCYFAMTNGWPKWKKEAIENGEMIHCVKPDLDNLTKASKDALNGIVWIDDSQVFMSSEAKYFDDIPRVEIIIEPINLAPSNIKRQSDMDQFFNS